MSNPFYKINPVKAVTRMFKEEGCGINTVNDACFGICSAFNNSNNNWMISSDCAKQCETLVNDMRIGKWGLGWCDRHRPDRPVKWVQVPSYFPGYFRETKDVKKALALSYKKCETTSLPQECKNKALLESYAVEKLPSPRTKLVRGVNTDDDGNPTSDYEKANPVVFWVGFILAAILIAVFLYVFVKMLKK